MRFIFDEGAEMLVNAVMSPDTSPKPAQIKPETPSFESLLEAVGQSQDREAFIALFEHFAPRVKSFLIKGGMSPEQADELAQETMLAVWHKAGNYNSAKAKASTWIFTIARNKRIDFLRKSGRESTVDYDTSLIEDSAPSPTENMMATQEQEAVAEALQSLPEDQAALIQKSFFEGKSHADIAAETNIPLGTIKSRIRLALEKLRGAAQIKALR